MTGPQNMIEIQMILDLKWMGDWKCNPNKMHVEAFERIQQAGLVMQPKDGTWTLSDKGLFYVDHLMAQPYPVYTFKIPTE